MSIATPDIPPTPQARSRIDLVDIGRGVALLAMFVFHFAYDLSFLGLVDLDVPSDPAWRAFARIIAGSFLTLVGVSLVLATRNGLNRPAYLKRLGKVAGAALLVTVGTWFAMPQNFIFFGILHHVALASLLALPFLRLHWLAIVLAAVVAFALPYLVAAPWLDRMDLAWLGLSNLPLQTADFVPVFPWFGCVLSGMLIGRLALAHPGAWMGWRAKSAPARLVAWGGRHSLLVYLAHQPVFIGGLTLAMQIMAIAAPAPEERPFMVSCQRSCLASGSDARTCQALCGCTVEGLKRAALWPKVLRDAMTPADNDRTSEIARACLRQP